MRKLGLLVAALLLLGVSAQAANAAGPENGLKAICAKQGGTYELLGNFPSCDGVDLIIWSDKETASRGSTQFTAIVQLCKAAGFNNAAAIAGPIDQDGRIGTRLFAWFCTN
jgi:hypothetical protein